MPTIIPIPAFADNYIWLVLRDGKGAVVDPGDAAPVAEERILTMSCRAQPVRSRGDVGPLRACKNGF
jgi:glyoxylase-like metal-dependent hydrolase (beta-lactamase superfamily II)